MITPRQAVRKRWEFWEPQVRLAQLRGEKVYLSREEYESFLLGLLARVVPGRGKVCAPRGSRLNDICVREGLDSPFLSPEKRELKVRRFLNDRLRKERRDSKGKLLSRAARRRLRAQVSLLQNEAC